MRLQTVVNGEPKRTNVKADPTVRHDALTGKDEAGEWKAVMTEPWGTLEAVSVT